MQQVITKNGFLNTISRRKIPDLKRERDRVVNLLLLSHKALNASKIRDCTTSIDNGFLNPRNANYCTQLPHNDLLLPPVDILHSRGVWILRPNKPHRLFPISASVCRTRNSLRHASNHGPSLNSSLVKPPFLRTIFPPARPTSFSESAYLASKLEEDSSS